MPSSMTGFGVADGAVGAGRIHVEIRTVNHRHFNVQLRLATPLNQLEEDVRKALRRRIVRGHVSLSARWTQEPPQVPAIAVDIERARAVVAALTELKTSLDLHGEIDVGFVARQPDVMIVGRAEDESALPADEFLAVMHEALDALAAMRQREGELLARDLEERLDAIAAGMATVGERAPARIVSERDRLRAAVAELLDGREVDESRLAQEIAFLAEKLDINEELVRLRSHLDAARAAIRGNEPAGRALGFLGQEMLREINTIGSKANDATITTAVIAMKGELDKFREQLENVE